MDIDNNFHQWHVSSKVSNEYIDILPKLHPNTIVKISGCNVYPEPVGRLKIYIDGFTNEFITLKYFLNTLPLYGIKLYEKNMRFGLTFKNVNEQDTHFNVNGVLHFSVGNITTLRSNCKCMNELFCETYNKPPAYYDNSMDI